MRCARSVIRPTAQFARRPSALSTSTHPSRTVLDSPLYRAMSSNTKAQGLALSAIVSALPSLSSHEEGIRPAHHTNDTATRFTNPWKSWREPTTWLYMAALWDLIRNPAVIPKMKELNTLIPSETPTWVTTAENASKIKATWLGHAAFLVELPTPPGASRGPRVLFDPALSVRCSPVQWLGPPRYTDMPTTIEDLPAIDAIILSHNHFDHTSYGDLQVLNARHAPHVFAGLENGPLLRSIGFPPERIHCLDWWDRSSLALALPAAGDVTGMGKAVDTTVEITCTPAQHQANRSFYDRWRTLWASWAVKGSTGQSVYFGGDTGYRTVREGEDEDAVPRCPAFREIGEKLGEFDLALLPIGAYAPRAAMSAIHSDPSDAVEIFKDIRAKRALAMHWGTWTLTNEPIMEPPQKLREACAKAGIAEGTFDICGLGETRVF